MAQITPPVGFNLFVLQGMANKDMGYIARSAFPLFLLMIFYIILGMFLDGISAVVLTMAIIEPMIRQAGFDMIWFGIFLVIVVEMAQITPPVGFNLFVLQGMANKDMGFIARSAFPLFMLMILAVILVVIFPEIALWMPQQMVQNIN